MANAFASSHVVVSNSVKDQRPFSASRRSVSAVTKNNSNGRAATANQPARDRYDQIDNPVVDYYAELLTKATPPMGTAHVNRTMSTSGPYQVSVASNFLPFDECGIIHTMNGLQVLRHHSVMTPSRSTMPALIPSPDSVQRSRTMNLSSEELRKSFQEKLEAFKAMERQFSSTNSQTQTTGHSKPLRKNTPATPIGSGRTLSSSSAAAASTAHKSLSPCSNRAHAIPDEPPVITKMSTSSIRSQTVDPSRSKLNGAKRTCYRIDDDVSSSRYRHDRCSRKASFCSSMSSNEDGTTIRSSSSPDHCVACDAIEQADRWKKRVHATTGFLKAANQRLTAITKCIESGKALNDFYREKHPFVSELAEEARILRRMRETSATTPQSSHYKSPPTNGPMTFLQSGSPSTTASSAGTIFGNAALFGRRTIGTAFSAISTPLKDRLNLSAQKPSPRPATTSLGLHSMLVKSQSLYEKPADSPGREMVERQKMKLIQSAFQPPPSNGDPTPSQLPSPQPERNWRQPANATAGCEQHAVTPSPQSVKSPPPWSSLIEATKSLADNHPEPAHNKGVATGVSPPPLTRRSPPLPMIDSERDWQICTLLDILLDQHDLIAQLNGFNSAILEEMKTVQSGIDRIAAAGVSTQTSLIDDITPTQQRNT
eukprot:Blabericola_migrator_1__11966@NODE_732_length_6695_cov_177_939348_g525_i1_p2_GENE_NODE_732_length_6695_cov_177_939348_g525_i1NODE_732_length_6695_cov_177_939348_g525_i1_p2_ORF_typecomplete_len654_score98_91SUIM_assoc/PF16619_5/0_54_NODE_732_length_6695_cov_177_939348_g525_i141986159